jgi:peptide deformylase
MAIRRIYRIDDEEEKKILKARCRPLKLPDPKLKHLIADMFETMHDANGVGLAAPQIGLSLALTVIETPAVHEKREDDTVVEVEPEQRLVLINPQIVKMSKEEVIRQEGCLSLPGWYGDVPRATWVTVEYQEPNGKRRRLRKAGGFLGWAIQHEVDHLNGVLFTERIRDLSTLRNLAAEEAARQEETRRTTAPATPAESGTQEPTHTTAPTPSAESVGVE